MCACAMVCAPCVVCVVCACVLTSLKLSPPLVGLVRRAFPYTNLAGLDALLPVYSPLCPCLYRVACRAVCAVMKSD